MKTRIITAVVALAGIIPFFWFSAPVDPSCWLNYLFPLLMSGIAFVSTWEVLHCIGLDKNYAISIPLYLAALAFPMLARVMRDMRAEYVRIAVLVALSFIVCFFAIIVFNFKKLPMGNVALTYMLSLYVIGSFSCIVLLRDHTYESVGGMLYLLPFIGSWVTDIFAYFTGRLFGKHKLLPEVSPKKTVEGAIGGAVFCALGVMLYGLVANLAFHLQPNYLLLAIVGLMISVVSQIGDLVLSAVKREFGVKDFGWMLPGHGGLLDRFDSSMAVTVLLMIVTTYFDLFIPA